MKEIKLQRNFCFRGQNDQYMNFTCNYSSPGTANIVNKY
jgi:hypothetical protein